MSRNQNRTEIDGSLTMRSKSTRRLLLSGVAALLCVAGLPSIVGVTVAGADPAEASDLVLYAYASGTNSTDPTCPVDTAAAPDPATECGLQDALNVAAGTTSGNVAIYLEDISTFYTEQNDALYSYEGWGAALTIATDPTLTGQATLDGGGSSGIGTSILLLSGTGSVAINNVAFQNGASKVFGLWDGGAINVRSSFPVTITNSQFTGNTAYRFGGAIAGGGDQTSNNFNIVGSTFANNTAAYGGAVSSAFSTAGTLAVSSSTFTNNLSSQGFGGAIASGFQGAGGAILSVTNSTFTGNSAEYSGLGGAIATGSGWGSITDVATITGSTFVNNSAPWGGAVLNGWLNDNAELTVENSTFVNNVTTDGGTGSAVMNGFLSTAKTTIIRSTIQSDADSGAVLANGYDNRGTFVVTGSVIAGSSSDLCNGTIISGGYNLEQDASSCGFSPVNHDLVGVDPHLASLAQNGGSTLTAAPESGSAIVGAIPNGSMSLTSSPVALCGTPRVDQAGYGESPGPCSIGALDFAILYAYAAGTNSTDPTCPLDTAASPDPTTECGLQDALNVAAGNVAIYLEDTSTSYTGQNGSLYFSNGGGAHLVITTDPNVSGRAVLDGQGSGGSILTLSGSDSVAINKLKFQNGFAANGGAINSTTSSLVSVANSVFENNVATGDGGAIDTADGRIGTLVVANSTFSGNVGSMGTAIDNGGNQGFGTLTVSGSTFLNNSGSYGGAITNANGGSGDVTIVNSTFSMNTATENGWGGAIVNGYYASGTMKIIRSTIDNGSATSAALDNVDGSLIVTGSVVAGAAFELCRGQITSGGYNLEQDSSSCGFSIATNDLVGVDPLLAPLASDGVFTQAKAPTATSPLIAAIPNGAMSSTNPSIPLCGSPRVDQSGQAEGNQSCSIGSLNFVVSTHVPGAAANVVATPGDTSASVAFTAPDNTGGSAITSYTVTATDLTNARNGGQSASGSTGPIVVTGLTNGDTYTFTVVATNAVGDGSPSTASDAVVPSGKPNSPTNVQVVAGDGQVEVSWTASTDANGSPITGYRAIVGTTYCLTTETSCTITGLTNGQPGRVFVVAINANGNSLATASASFKPFGLPFAATSVTATAGDKTATVKWAAALNNGSAISGYVASDGQGHSCATTGPSCVITGLTNGQNYSFTVVATNGAGAGAASISSNLVTPSGKPLAPTSVQVTPKDRSADVSWTPSDANGSPITGFKATASTGQFCTTSGDTSCTILGLTNGANFSVKVVATNANGNSLASVASTISKPFGSPFAATSVTATAGDKTATVKWAAALNNGSAISGYVASDGQGHSCATTGPSCVITGLTNGQNYSFTVVATNGAGAGAASISSNLVTPSGKPLAPTSVQVTPASKQVVVSWTASDANGSPITAYKATASTGQLCSTTGATSCTITGLTAGKSFTVSVVATNANGNSPASVASAKVAALA